MSMTIWVIHMLDILLLASWDSIDGVERVKTPLGVGSSHQSVWTTAKDVIDFVGLSDVSPLHPGERCLVLGTWLGTIDISCIEAPLT